MKMALIRLEDVGPGGYYESVENQAKLLAVADYLYKNGVRFQVAVIPRFVDPPRGINRSLADPSDPVSARYSRMLYGLVARGASLGIHGFTHQYGQAVSAEGYEFYYPECHHDCAPDDSSETLTDRAKFQQSYACRRFRMALAHFHAAGLRPDWFETPHYTASPTQRVILETCSGLVYEDNPDLPGSRTVTFRRSPTSFSKGAWYVPTPLSYVGGASVDEDVNRIVEQMGKYREGELASFFYHPFLEFPYIQLHADASPSYSEQSPLKKLIRDFHSNGRRFLSILQLFQPIGRPPVNPINGV